MGPYGICLRVAALACIPFGLSAADFTTYIGDTHDYRIARVIAGPAGSTYIGGTRDASIFAMKLDATGRSVLHATLSGKGGNQVNDMAIDADGNIYLAGSTTSSLLPLRNPLQSKPGPGFAVKLNPNATEIVFGTYFPAAIQALAIDASGNLYLTGTTYSSDFPVTQGLPAGTVTPPTSINATSAAFLTKIAASGDRIVYSMRISGHQKNCGAGSSCFLSARTTTGNAVAVDAAGNAYLAGNTDTYDLPATSGVFLGAGTGAFAAKVSAAGNALVYLTYIGAGYHPITPFTNPDNLAYAIAADATGNAYLRGSVFDEISSSTGVFVAKLNPLGTAVLWKNALVGNAGDSGHGIALDVAGSVWLAGSTASGDFVAAWNSSGSALTYHMRLPAGTASAGLSVDSAGTLHLAGAGGLVSTISPALPFAPRIYGIANAAYGLIGARVSPGEVISFYGILIGPSTPIVATPDTAGAMPRTLGGVQVLFDGAPIPLLYVSETQINAVAPLRFSTTAPRWSVRFNASQSADLNFTAIPSNPQVFQRPDGSAAAVNQDGSINSPEHPALPGTIVAIWATGIGSTPPNFWEDGRISPNAAALDCCRIVADKPANVVYAGSAPGIVAGVAQVNFQVTSQLAAQGPVVSIALATRDATSNPVKLYVRAPLD